ncbi:MAG: NAD-dependent epimerase/dehydratase family protein [Nitrospirae bacterium]|nr:NAD-dependent epimerase/dehydratase family protein [Nitrospirota bacterium]
MGKCVLVTGGAGFIGSHIVDRLIASGNEVIVADDLSTGKKENLNPAAIFYDLDIKDLDALRPVFEKHRIDHVIHEAAKINLNVMLEDPYNDVHSSIISTINLLKCSAEFKVLKFIYASSVAVYGKPSKLPAAETDELQPVYSYGIVKKCAEDYVRYFSDNYGLNYSILRYANVYGPRQPIFGEVGVIAIYTDKVLKGEPLVIFGNGNHLRDYIYIDDVVDVTLKTLEAGDRETFNIGRGAGVSVNTVFDNFQHCLGKKIEFLNKPERVGELGRFFTDSGKAEKLLGWKAAIGTEEGIKRTMDYYRKLNS